MAYSYTEKKRIRKNFGKLPSAMDILTCCPFRLILTDNLLRTALPPRIVSIRACMLRLNLYFQLSATPEKRFLNM